ncbi:MAG: GldG family protein [Verrucomicrobiota bacterium]|jgi:hypothetical protein|nr:GldG family protein [Verrucomicrobiota bacterium]
MKGFHLPTFLTSCRARRVLWRSNLVVLTGLAAAIFFMVNYLCAQHYTRFHWLPTSFTRLSDKSLQLLETVPGDIRVTALLRPSHPAYRGVTALLQEYAAHSAKLSFSFIDPDRNMAQTEEAVRRYALSSEEVIVFDIGGRHQTISADDLIEYGYPDDEQAGRFQRAFRGEQQFSGAIRSLTQTTRQTVCFTQGHGERSPVDFDRHRGYSQVASRLRDENLDVERLNLGEAKAVPSRCDLLIVAGPLREFTPFEVNLIRDYLNRKGRLLLLLDARIHTGLEALMEDWGVRLGNDILVDPTRSSNGRDLYASTYPEHPITAPLQGLTTVFSFPRSVRPLLLSSGGDKPIVSDLVLSSPEGWAEFDPDDTTLRFDSQVDIPGPVPLAVAIERGPVPGVHIQIRPTRLVILGDSGFASNAGLVGANIDLFLNAVHWLLEYEEGISIAPKTLEDLHVVMNARQLQRLFWVVVVALPLLVGVWGLFVVWRRKR